MTDAERETLRQKLIAEIDATRHDIESLEEKTQPIAPDDAIGRITRMEAINSKSVHEAALTAALGKLPKLEQALAKVDQPKFGKCVRCGDEIPLARLMFMPESDRCMKCVRR